MTSIEEFLEQKHPEILAEYKKLAKEEEDAITLDTTITDLFDGNWTEKQKAVIDEIYASDDRPCEYISWSNWKNCPYLGDLVHEGPLDPSRYETISNDEMLERVLPVEDDFSKSWYEEHKFTVGQINEILMWFWNEADTSVTWDW